MQLQFSNNKFALKLLMCRSCVYFNIMYLLFAETPLILSTALQKPRDVIIALVSGGAHIDFRNKSGMTAMHYAALHGNTEAIKVCK